jgi:hypothetical protein
MRYTILRRAALGIIALLAVVLLVGACGSAGDQSSGTPTEVQITI